MTPTAMQYVRSALAQALCDGMDMQEVINIACETSTPERFDEAVEEYTRHTMSPDELVTYETKDGATGVDHVAIMASVIADPE